MKIFNNKRGYSVGFAWVFALVSLFGIGVMYIVFSQVFNAELVPTIKTMANNSYEAGGISLATLGDINDGIDKYMVFFNTLPFVLFFVIVVYMIVVAIRKERTEEFQ